MLFFLARERDIFCLKSRAGGFGDWNFVDVVFTEAGDHYLDMSNLIEVERFLEELGNARLKAFAGFSEVGG